MWVVGTDCENISYFDKEHLLLCSTMLSVKKVSKQKQVRRAVNALPQQLLVQTALRTMKGSGLFT